MYLQKENAYVNTLDVYSQQRFEDGGKMPRYFGFGKAKSPPSINSAGSA
jgi:hypothetical protein